MLTLWKKWMVGAGGFFGRHPLFAAAVIVVAAVLGADFEIWAGVVVGVFAGWVGWISGSWRRGTAWVICGLVAVTVFGIRGMEREKAERELIGSGGVVTARILTDGRGNGFYWSAPARLESGAWKGTKVWWESTGKPPLAGSIVEARGSFLKLQGARNPAEFDQAAWLKRKGMVANFRGQMMKSETGKWARLGGRIRGGFRAAVTAGLAEDSIEAKVIRAIVIGEAPPDADEVIAAFRNSGTLHIFSVSGMHVAMVGSIGWFVLRLLRVPRRWAVLAILPLMFGYSWISGNSAPAVRSAWMMAVFLMAFVLRRRPDLLNSLGAVLLVAMIWDGNLLFQPGVQLSYGVVAAIAVGTSWASRAFGWIGKKEEYLPDDLIVGWRAWWLGGRRKIAQSLGVSAAAWIGSTPLTIFHFGLVTPIALIGTLVLTIPVYMLLTLALVSAALHPLWAGGAVMVNRFNAKAADFCVWEAERLSAIPGSHFSTRSPGEPMLLIYDLEYGAAAACFSGGKDGAVLIDCGDGFAFKNRVVKSLRGLGISPDSIVLTHPDGGHIGGGSDVWEAFPVRQVLMPVERSRSPGYKVWTDQAPKAGVNLVKIADVDILPFPDGARLETLYVPRTDTPNIPADDRVAVFKLHWRGWKILLTSDSGIAIEEQLLASGKDLSADVIVAGKNRRSRSLGDAFLNSVVPQAIIASHAEFPKEERLDPRQADYWRSRGIHVISQKDAGGVTIRIDENGDLLIEGYVDGSVVRLKRRDN